MRRLDSRGGEDARDASEVVGDAHVGPVKLDAEYFADVIRGVVAEFEDENSAGPKQRARLLDESRVDFDASGAAEKGRVRLVVADLASKSGGVVACDIGRIADNQIEKV